MKKFAGILILSVLLTGGVFCYHQYSVQAEQQSYQSPIKKTQVRASHILVKSEAEALKIKSEIESGKITFEEAAKKYSLCPSGQNGGDLGYFGRKVMVKEFEDASFSLPVGKISAPVKTQFGYHLVKVTGIK